MLLNQGDDLEAVVTFTADGEPLTGLVDVTISLYRNGSGSAVSSGAGTEWVGGAYRRVFSGSLIDADGSYLAVGVTANGTADRKVDWSFYLVGKAGTSNLDAPLSTINTAVSDLADQVDTWFADTTPILDKVDSTLVLDTGSVYQFTANALELADRTGYKLASDGLDLIAVPTLTGPAGTFPGYVYQLWRRFFKKAVNDKTGNTLKTYGDNGTTVVTTQTTSSLANVETVGHAS